MKMPAHHLCHLDVSDEPERRLIDRAEAIFDAVWRFDFAFPGFCLLDLGAEVNSQALRVGMIRLKERLGEIAARRLGVRFRCRSHGRFDQQETTRFHLDGAPEQSLLMLGYEPSSVVSRLSLADYTRCAFDLAIEPRRFLNDFNPMFRKGVELLDRYVTTLPEIDGRHSYLLLINNSSLPYDDSRTNPLGVLHKAEVPHPSESQRRIVNSLMLETTSDSDPDEIEQTQQQAFLATDAISQKVSGPR